MKKTGLQRDSIIEWLNESAFEKVKFISPDFGAKPLDTFRDQNHNSFIYPGIAEQVSADIAYGISLGGSLPIVYGMSPFISARCFEQYKVLFGQTNQPICILPVGVGLGYDHNTLSHYSLDDIGLYSSVPGLKIFNPSDCNSAIDLVSQWINSPEQIVIRLERQEMPIDLLTLHNNLEPNEYGFNTSKSSSHLVISWGYLGNKLLESSIKKGFDILLFNKMYFEEDFSLESYISTYEKISIVEESYVNTGIGALILPYLIKMNSKIELKHIKSSISNLRAHRSTIWREFSLDKYLH